MSCPGVHFSIYLTHGTGVVQHHHCRGSSPSSVTTTTTTSTSMYPYAKGICSYRSWAQARLFCAPDFANTITSLMTKLLLFLLHPRNLHSSVAEKFLFQLSSSFSTPITKFSFVKSKRHYNFQPLYFLLCLQRTYVNLMYKARFSTQ